MGQAERDSPICSSCADVSNQAPAFLAQIASPGVTRSFGRTGVSGGVSWVVLETFARIGAGIGRLQVDKSTLPRLGRVAALRS